MADTQSRRSSATGSNLEAAPVTGGSAPVAGMSHLVADRPANDEPAKDEPRSPGAIEADIAATRDHLAHTLDEIAVRVDPRTLARRGADRVRGQAERARLQVVDLDGRPRAGRLAALGGVVTAGVAALVLLRRRR